jgi:radical SAM superfamily enzyme YgiQ (UPF0313 family)
MKNKINVYLADLSHTGQGVSANFFPLGVGYVASYLLKELADQVNVELFKYPEDLSRALSKNRPKIVAFSNYSWNLNLSYEYLKQIKLRSPETITVMGGPNYGLTQEEKELFWRRYPLVDFYIVFEGEYAFVELVKNLDSVNFDPKRLKQNFASLSNCHYQFDGKIVEGEFLPRVKELQELPSPYLSGLMDKFFDGVLIPMISTTRGCPFRCTFCTEGNDYYAKVAKTTDLNEDLEYIVSRVGTVKDLCMTDANFGMFKEDIDKAKTLAAIQKKYDWPKNLIVSSGKNQKERVLEVASIVNGAMYAGGAMQTTDPEILKNIKRSNISLEEMSETVSNQDNNDVDSYTELILALPGDNKKSHTKSLRDMVNMGVNRIRMLQLIMLPQTEINTADTREKYKMKTKFRLMPRSFGRYEIFGEELSAVEYEEICVSNSTLSFEEYLECRELHLTIETLNNGKIFQEFSGLCRYFGVSWFDVIKTFHSRRRDCSSDLEYLYDTFRKEATENLWDSPDDLERAVSRDLTRYLSNDEGTNEMAKGKTRAIFQMEKDIHRHLMDSVTTEFKNKGIFDKNLKAYLQDLMIYIRVRKEAPLNTGKEMEALLNYDFNVISERGYSVDPKDFRLAQPTKFIFKHSKDQVGLIDAYTKQYGTSLDGLGRTLMRAQYKTLIRKGELLGAQTTCSG